MEDVAPLTDDRGGEQDSWYNDIYSEPEEMQLDGLDALFNSQDGPETENDAADGSGDHDVDGTESESPNPGDFTSTSQPPNSDVPTASPSVNKKKSRKNKRKRYRPYGNTTVSKH